MKRPYKKRKRRKEPRIVNHHISYRPERTVKVFDGEHMILTRLQWRKRISQGFIKALKEWIANNEKSAIDLKLNPESVELSLKGGCKLKHYRRKT